MPLHKKGTFYIYIYVLFFLNKSETDRIFSFFNTIQHTGDYIGSVSYNEDIKKTEAFTRLLRYANKGVVDASPEGFQLIENDFYQNLRGYKLINHEDYFSCSKLYDHKPQSDLTDILNEHFYILRKG